MNIDECESKIPNIARSSCSLGLTKRELFAGMALQGMLSCSETGGTYASISKSAYEYADAMLSESGKEKEKK